MFNLSVQWIFHRTQCQSSSICCFFCLLFSNFFLANVKKIKIRLFSLINSFSYNTCLTLFFLSFVVLITNNGNNNSNDKKNFFEKRQTDVTRVGFSIYWSLCVCMSVAISHVLCFVFSWSNVILLFIHAFVFMSFLFLLVVFLCIYLVVSFSFHLLDFFNVFFSRFFHLMSEDLGSNKYKQDIIFCCCCITLNHIICCVIIVSAVISFLLVVSSSSFENPTWKEWMKHLYWKGA